MPYSLHDLTKNLARLPLSPRFSSMYRGSKKSRCHKEKRDGYPPQNSRQDKVPCLADGDERVRVDGHNQKGCDDAKGINARIARVLFHPFFLQTVATNPSTLFPDTSQRAPLGMSIRTVGEDRACT